MIQISSEDHTHHERKTWSWRTQLMMILMMMMDGISAKMHTWSRPRYPARFVSYMFQFVQLCMYEKFLVPGPPYFFLSLLSWPLTTTFKSSYPHMGFFILFFRLSSSLKMNVSHVPLLSSLLHQMIP